MKIFLSFVSATFVSAAIIFVFFPDTYSTTHWIFAVLCSILFAVALDFFTDPLLVALGLKDVVPPYACGGYGTRDDDYEPWFAWRPVLTDAGWAWMTTVFRCMWEGGIEEDAYGTYYRKYKCSVTSQN